MPQGCRPPSGKVSHPSCVEDTSAKAQLCFWLLVKIRALSGVFAFLSWCSTDNTPGVMALQVYWYLLVHKGTTPWSGGVLLLLTKYRFSEGSSSEVSLQWLSGPYQTGKERVLQVCIPRALTKISPVSAQRAPQGHHHSVPSPPLLPMFQTPTE